MTNFYFFPGLPAQKPDSAATFRDSKALNNVHAAHPIRLLYPAYFQALMAYFQSFLHEFYCLLSNFVI
ncbi:MAG: hypothetical protein DBX42_02735 [Azospirillum sp.]|nr:MAG: hypothetical protein DBX42_02735 [Azospirillum sp.]